MSFKKSKQENDEHTDLEKNNMENVMYSVVIPVYNSESTLVELFDRIKIVFTRENKDFEVIFVEDSGRDGSWEILCYLKLKNPDRIKIIRLAKNFGQHNAILCGFGFAKGDFIITLDDDLQNPPEEIPNLIEKQAEMGYEVIYGIASAKKHSFFRNIGSWVIQRIFVNIFKAKGPISPFRVIKKELVQKIILHKQSFVFIDGLIHWYTRFIGYVNVQHFPRNEGSSGYNFKKLLQLASNLLFNFTTIPLHAMIYLGFFFSIVTFTLGMIFVFRKFIYNVPLGYTSIVVSLFFIASIFLWVLGIIGEYISRIFSVQNDKPSFSIKEIK